MAIRLSVLLCSVTDEKCEKLGKVRKASDWEHLCPAGEGSPAWIAKRQSALLGRFQKVVRLGWFGETEGIT